MLTEQNMISICRRVEDIAMRNAFKVFAISINTYRFDGSDVISLYARINEGDEECFSQNISSSSTNSIVADSIVDAFERFLSVEG